MDGGPLGRIWVAGLGKPLRIKVDTLWVWCSLDLHPLGWWVTWTGPGWSG